MRFDRCSAIFCVCVRVPVCQCVLMDEMTTTAYGHYGENWWNHARDGAVAGLTILFEQNRGQINQFAVNLNISLRLNSNRIQFNILLYSDDDRIHQRDQFYQVQQEIYRFYVQRSIYSLALSMKNIVNLIKKTVQRRKNNHGNINH